MSHLGNERSSVQNTLIKYACKVGWSKLRVEEAERLRGGRSSLIFKEVFMAQIKA